jgi:hypothetical protein
MTRIKISIGILAGLFLAMVAAVVLSGSYATPRALAQAQQPAAASHRYRISAWGSGAAPTALTSWTRRAARCGTSTASTSRNWLGSPEPSNLAP